MRLVALASWRNKVDALHSSFVAYYLVHCFQHSNDEAYLSNVLLNHRS